MLEDNAPTLTEIILNHRGHYKDGYRANTEWTLEEAIETLVFRMRERPYDSCLTAYAAGRVKKLLP